MTAAQPVDRADLARCAAMSTDARKLSCFESLLEEPATASVDSAADEAAAVPSRETRADALPVDTPRVAEDVAAREAESADADRVALELGANTEAEMPTDVERVGESTAAVADAVPSLSSQGAAISAQPMTSATAPDSGIGADNVDGLSADPVLEAPGTLSDEFGREHVANVAVEPEERVTATVTNVTRDYTKRLVFQFANGQVWRQQEARRFRYPKGGAFEVEIARGVFGDYQLRVDGEGRMTRIKRLQ